MKCDLQFSPLARRFFMELMQIFYKSLEIVVRSETSQGTIHVEM